MDGTDPHTRKAEGMNYPYGYDATEHDRFTKDLYAKYGVSDNPKRDKAYSIAWEMGHAYGYSEVESHFSDIVALIKD